MSLRDPVCVHDILHNVSWILVIPSEECSDSRGITGCSQVFPRELVKTRLHQLAGAITGSHSFLDSLPFDVAQGKQLGMTISFIL